MSKLYLNIFVGVSVVFSITTVLSQDFLVPDTEYERDFVIKKVAEYAIDARKDRKVIPLHVYYSSIFRKSLFSNDTSSFNPLEIEALRELDSPNNSRFVEYVWSEMEGICESIEKDSSQKNIVSNAERMDEISITYDEILNEYYENFVKSLTIPAQIEIENEVESMMTRENIGYVSIRVHGIALDDSSLGKKLILDGCNNFRTIDVDKELERNRDLKLGDEKLQLTAIRSKQN